MRATGAKVWRPCAPIPGEAHAGFEGADVCPEADPAQRFGGSIPLDMARRCAWWVPGYIGARSVRWLERIELRPAPWDGYFQHVAYRLLPEDGTPGPGAGMPLGLVALTPAPASGSTPSPSREPLSPPRYRAPS